jgi:SAM-dependent methyltransferase
MPGPGFYNTVYRLGRAPWEIGPRPELVDLVRSGRLRPCRAVDLGCGTGGNFSRVALAKAAATARAADVSVRFVEDDLTALHHELGTFDLLVDYGTLDDLATPDRDRYVDSVLPLASSDARFLLWCFEWPPRRLDRWLRFQPIAPAARSARSTWTTRRRYRRVAACLRVQRLVEQPSASTARHQQIAMLNLAAHGIAVAPGAPFEVNSLGADHIRITVGLVRDGFEDLADVLADAAGTTHRVSGRRSRALPRGRR